MDSDAIQAYLNSLRERSGMSYRDIAIASGISASTVHRLMHEPITNPNLSTILPVVEAMGATREDFFASFLPEDSPPPEAASSSDASPSSPGSSFSLRLMSMLSTAQEQHIRHLHNIIVVESIALSVLVLLLLVFFVWFFWDVTHPSEGLIRLFQSASH